MCQAVLMILGMTGIEFEDEMRAGVEPGRSVDSSGIDY